MFSLSISVIRVLHRLCSSYTTQTPKDTTFIVLQRCAWVQIRCQKQEPYFCFYHGSPGFEEPVEAELWRVADALAQLVVHALLVKAQLVEHADEEAVLLLRVVLAFVGAIGDAELMERSLVATDLGK